MSTATLITCVEGVPAQDERFLQLWRQAQDLLRRGGGYRTTRLHRTLGPQARFRFVDVAEPDSVETWQPGVDPVGVTPGRRRGRRSRSGPGWSSRA